MVTKKAMLYGSAVVLSGTVMVTSGFSAMANGQDGYQVLKNAVKQSHQVESGTMTGTVKVLNNNAEVLQLQFGMKGSQNPEAASGTLTVSQGDQTQGAAFYYQDSKAIVKLDGDDSYYVHESVKQHHSRKHHKSDGRMDNRVEELVDALVGKYRTYLKLEDQGDAGKVVTLSMNDQEMPALLNAAGSLWIEGALSADLRKELEKDSELAEHPLHNMLKLDLPEVGTDVHLEQIDMKIMMDKDNLIKEHSIVVEATSKDSQGQTQEWTFEIQMEFTGINQTTADTVNLEGKTTKLLEGKWHH